MSYNWSISGNATIIDHPEGFGENDTIVRVKFYSNFTSGTIYVSAANSCGYSAPKTKSILIYKAGIVGTITANEINTCPQRIVGYSVASFPAYADSIIWRVPSVGTIISGQGTDSITVSYPSNINLSSLVSATSINNCSVGYTRYLRVSFVAISCPVVNPAGKEDVITQREIKTEEHKIEVAVYPNPTTDYFNVKVNSKVKEKISLMIYDIQGREMKRIQVNAGELNKMGTEFKSGIYFLKVFQNGVSVTEKLIKQ